MGLETRANRSGQACKPYGEPSAIIKETGLPQIETAFSILLKKHPSIAIMVDHGGVLVPYKFGKERKWIEENFGDQRAEIRAKHAIDRLPINKDLLAILSIFAKKGGQDTILACASEVEMAEALKPQFAHTHYSNPILERLMAQHVRILTCVGNTQSLNTRLKDGSLMIYMLDPNPDQQDLPGLLPGYSRRFQPHTQNISMIYTPVPPFTQPIREGYRATINSAILRSLQGPIIKLPNPITIH